MNHNHIPARQGHPRSETDLCLKANVIVNQAGWNCKFLSVLEVGGTIYSVRLKIYFYQSDTWGNLSSMPSLWGSPSGNTSDCRLRLQSSFSARWGTSDGGDDSFPSRAAYKTQLEVALLNCLTTQCRLEKWNKSEFVSYLAASERLWSQIMVF